MSTNNDGAREAAEDEADRAAVAEFRRKLATGEERLIPAAEAECILADPARLERFRREG